MSASACHPSCCTLVSSDERQPPNMWQGHGPCGKWFGKCSIYSVSQCFAFLKLLSCKQGIHLQCWYSAFKINAQFCEVLFKASVSITSLFLWWYKGGGVQLQWISVLDISVEIMWIEMYVQCCVSDNTVKIINLFTFKMVDLFSKKTGNTNSGSNKWFIGKYVWHRLQSCPRH